MAGPVPLYGMCVILMPVMAASSSPARWLVVPMPGEPYWTFPGAALAIPIRSATERAGTEGCTASTLGAIPMRPIPAKSLRGS
jgi:hypothetical protein